MNRKDLAQAVQKAWNELAPNERFYWFRNASRDSTKQPAIKAMVSENRASCRLILKKLNSLNLNDPRFKDTETDNNEYPQQADFVLRKQNSSNFRDPDGRDTEMNNDSVSTNISRFVGSRSNADVFQSFTIFGYRNKIH